MCPPPQTPPPGNPSGCTRGRGLNAGFSPSPVQPSVARGKGQGLGGNPKHPPSTALPCSAQFAPQIVAGDHVVESWQRRGLPVADNNRIFESLERFVQARLIVGVQGQ